MVPGRACQAKMSENLGGKDFLHAAGGKDPEPVWAVHCLWLGRGIFSHGRARMRDRIKEVKEYFVRPLMVVDGHLPCCLACFLPSQSAL